MDSNPRLGVLLVLAAATLWGTTGTARALGDGQASAYWFGALRLLAASAFFVVYALATRASAATSHGAPPRVDAFAAGLCMAVYNLAFFAGIAKTGVGLGTAVALGSGPIWAGLMQAALDRQPPPAAWWAGALVAVAGGIAMSLGAPQAADAFDPLGIGLCLLSGASYAAYTLLNRRMAQVASASAITLRAFTIAAAIAIPFAWLQGGAPTPSGADVGAIVYTGVVATGVSYLLFSHAMRHVSPATGVTLALAEPVVAFGLAVALLGERPGAIAYAGLVLVVAGVLIVVRQELAAGARASDAALPAGRPSSR